MTAPPVKWTRSSYSTGANNCLEAARLDTAELTVRDSKDPHGPALRFTATAWRAFLRAVKSGAL
jgi:Domain of unknown function (DUF397)